MSSLVEGTKDCASRSLYASAFSNVACILLGGRPLLDLKANKQKAFAVQHIHVDLTRVIYWTSNDTPACSYKGCRSGCSSAPSLLWVASDKAIHRRGQILQVDACTCEDERVAAILKLSLKCLASPPY